MKIFQCITLILFCGLFSGCSISSNLFIVNISNVPGRISYQLKSLEGSGFFGKTVSKYKLIRDEEKFEIGLVDSAFVYSDSDLVYEIIVYPNEALNTGFSSYNNMMKNTQYCASAFSNMEYLSIIKSDEPDSLNFFNDSLLITGGMMCSVIEEIKKYDYTLVIR